VRNRRDDLENVITPQLAGNNYLKGQLANAVIIMCDIEGVSPTHDMAASTDEEDDEDDLIDGDEETVFKYKVSKLTLKSGVFLQMLNDMRRRSRELPDGSPAEEQYRYTFTTIIITLCYCSSFCCFVVYW